jgi:hypothetical protein
VLETGKQTLEQSVNAVLGYLEKNGYLSR